ncbi:hypothetical protein FSARC_10046 [Fusarium sarcochroum]|uniref:N-acetyltransferase domain-containing protein n=1 Tax=Fusarium sarcochroum TaxID=1208366 RepID=A0A8H4TPQ8_9HYPO|nr:hypothetical protein FSARC_10046 [Fusarium sarcochroum]
MTSATSQLRNTSWRQDSYLVSTDPSLVPIPKIVEVFASDEFYWAKPLPEDAMRAMLDNCLCFALYDTSGTPENQDGNGHSSFQFIGLSRGITDFTTFLYLTDVWIDPAYRGKGLGTWLMKCVREVIESMPYLRKSMLVTGDWEKTVPFYENLMDMKVTEGQPGETRAIMERRGRGHPNFGR